MTVKDAVGRALEAERRLSLEIEAVERVSNLRTEMMRTISHEIRTPLSVMVGYAQLSAEDARRFGMNESMISNLDEIAARGMHIANMVEEMSQLVIIPEYSKDRVPLEITSLIHRVTAMFEKVLAHEGRKLFVDMPDNLPQILGSENDITQVMFNLLRNAQLHGEHGKIMVSASIEGDEIKVIVSDEGKGIDPNFLPRVFERGASENEDGSGYGLSICKDIIHAYGGEMSIESEPGKGTTIWFTLKSTEGV
jgi:signal transduction histidine kinase